MAHKRIVVIIAALALLAGALGTGLAIAQQGGGKEEADARPLQVPLIISHQGQLLDANHNPVNDPHDLTFYLYDDPVAGNLLWAEDHIAVTFDDGLYAVQLGSITPLDPILFDQPLHLGVSVDSNPEMAPRIPIDSVPYALNADRLDGLDANDFRSLTGNVGTTPGTDFLGTTDFTALEFQVNGLRALRLEPNSTSPNINGGTNTLLAPGVVGVTISGGGAVGNTTLVTDDFGTIGGGKGNQAGDNAGAPTDAAYATVGGGELSTASGDSATVGGGAQNVASKLASTVGGGDTNTSSALYATVGGGLSNTASGLNATVGGGGGVTASGSFSTVGGGSSNTASALYATVAGGSNNNANANYSTVSGGNNNTANGLYSFAAGRRAIANHDGAFVWADTTNADFFSNAANQFNILASGGTRIFSNSNVSAGVLLAAGGNAWSAVSDKAYKENFALVDARNILEKLSEMPVGQCNLASQDPSIQHMGPTAQDFHAAFGLGESDTLITSLDTDGVAIAAIQGLYQLTQKRDAEIADLREAVGMGSTPTSDESLGFVQSITWALLGGILAVGLYIAARLRHGRTA